MSEISYPSPEEWEYATPRQVNRAARSFDVLRRKCVPVYGGPLMVPDDDEVVGQSIEAVLHRMLVLWAVALHGDGHPQDEIHEMIQQYDLWDVLTPSERTFLLDESPSDAERMAAGWRLECIAVLMWSLGLLDQPSWPDEQCEAMQLAEILDAMSNLEYFVGKQPRSVSELLDARDLMMRLQWAIRNAWLHQGAMVPADLNWAKSDDWVPVQLSCAALIVQERLYTLVWLTNGSDGPDWDDMDTST
jgi:hypothetical protein